jgi:DNA-binding MarR family transcriptional regulator
VDSLPAALTDLLGPLLGRAHTAHRALAERRLAELGLSPKAFGALSVLASEGATSQQRLAERQGIDRTTMVAVIDELEHAGFVERRRSHADRRAYALHATPKGERVLARARDANAAAEDEFLAPLAPAERERLKETLRTLVRATPGTAREAPRARHRRAS